MADVLGVGIIGAGWITRPTGWRSGPSPFSTRSVVPSGSRCSPARGRERGEAMAASARASTGSRPTGGQWSKTRPSTSSPTSPASRGHREATEAALALGKPVLCEKPLGVDRFEARSMRRRSRRAAGVQAVTGFNYRYVPAMRLARDIVRSGALGRIVHFRATYLQDYAAGRVRRSSRPTARAPCRDYAHIARLPALPRLRGRGRHGDRRQADDEAAPTSRTPTSRRSTSSAAGWARSRRRASPAAGRAASVVEVNGTDRRRSGGTWRT